MLLNPHLTVLVCAHDAGGANQLFAWAERVAPHVHLVQQVAGPAEDIFTDRFPAFTDWADIHALVCGTGWQSDTEFNAIVSAKAQGICSIAYLDHWVNYDMRFERRGQQVLPEQIWCADSMAVSVAKQSQVLRSLPIKNIGNYYWRNVQNRLPEKQQNTILLVHEPVRDPTVDQNRLIENCLTKLSFCPSELKLVFRVHPSGLDHFGECLFAALNKVYRCEFSSSSLSVDLANAAVVVGYLSAALVMAAAMGFPVRSFCSGQLPDYLTCFGVR